MAELLTISFGPDGKVDFVLCIFTEFSCTNFTFFFLTTHYFLLQSSVDLMMVFK